MAGRSGRLGVLGSDSSLPPPPIYYGHHDDDDDVVDPSISPNASPSKGRNSLQDRSPNSKSRLQMAGGDNGKMSTDAAIAADAADSNPAAAAAAGSNGGRMGTRNGGRRSSSSSSSGKAGGSVAKKPSTAAEAAGGSAAVPDLVASSAANAASGSVAHHHHHHRQQQHKQPHHQPQLAQVHHFGTGCLTCGADDDHANLLLCERCNAEYHTYCLDPPLHSVPEGDWFCDKCKPFHLHDGDDGLNRLVSALPPTFTSRFGEIVWAAGGVGFGWWPACIYDPRLTIGGARQLAKKNLGKKHLVYFFECHDAPFTVLGTSKLCPWEEGLLEEYDLGKTARNSGKNRAILFEHALQTALMEVSKPMDLRMEWNHSNQPPQGVDDGKQPQQQIMSPPRRHYGNALGKRSGDGGALSLVGDGRDGSQGSKKQKRNQQGGGNGDKANVRRSGRLPKPLSRPGNVVDGGVGPVDGGQQQSSRRIVTVKRTNVNTAMKALSGRRNSGSGAIEIEPAEDGQLFCKILRKLSPLSDNRKQKELAVDYAGSNLGFVAMPSRRAATYADLRQCMESDLDEGCLPSQGNFKFYVPKLGPVSTKQETKLGPVLDFLKNTTADERLGDGSSWNPLKIVVMDCSAT